MLRTIFFALLFLNFLASPLSALEVSLQGAKQNHEEYSIIHIRDKNNFLCQEIKDDFDIPKQIVCAFTKSPSQKLKKIQNNFFKINNQTKEKTFFLIINPYEKMKLYPVIFDLTHDNTIYSPEVKMSKHWMIVGYKNELPYIKENNYSDLAINFPFTYSYDAFPFVGSLDMQGNPVYVKRVGDVKEYIRIKNLYKDKRYERCLDLIDEIMYDYPNSLFTPELLYYKIKSFAALKNDDALIDAAKIYLREYSSDENIPEVLALVARSYYIEGFNTDAEYFFDRLFSEHSSSVYAEWGLVYRAQMYESLGSASKAKAMYIQVINKTTNIDVAIEAAYSLAKYYISTAKYKEANKYIQKITKAKPIYFKEHMSTSMDMMYDLSDAMAYEAAASISKALSDALGPQYDEYEELLHNIGIWLTKTDKKKKALNALNDYLKKFPDGDYLDAVTLAKDSLFFDSQDTNFTTKLANYDNLIKEYVEDSIGRKATYEKAKLLIKNDKFREALDLEDELLKLDKEVYPEIAEIITKAAVGSMKMALEKKECQSVLEISAQYKIELSDKWDDGVYLCAMRGANFTLAKKMTDKNLKSKDLEQRKKWLYRHIKIDFATGNYSNVIEASQELIILINEDKKSPYIDVNRYLFDTYSRLENSQKMIESMSKIEKVYGLDYKDIDRYIKVMNIGSQTKDNNLVIEYAKKVMQIQKNSSSYAQSPFVEFTLYQAYIDKENNNDALKVIKSLDDRELSKINRARQKYLLGSIYDKLWRDDNAQEAYDEAIKAQPDSAWANLAKDAKKI